MYRLDLQSFNWDLVGTKGGEINTPPGSIDEHTANLDGNQIVIFGGFEDGTRVNHVHTFDVETLTWQKIETADALARTPKPRAGHSGVIQNGSLYVFGGKDDDNNKLEDLWKFDLSSRTWTQLITDETYNRPMARSGHSAILYQNYIGIFGGIFEVTKELNDFHLYDITNNKWIKLFSEKVE